MSLTKLIVLYHLRSDTVKIDLENWIESKVKDSTPYERKPCYREPYVDGMRLLDFGIPSGVHLRGQLFGSTRGSTVGSNQCLVYFRSTDKLSQHWTLLRSGLMVDWRWRILWDSPLIGELGSFRSLDTFYYYSTKFGKSCLTSC